MKNITVSLLQTELVWEDAKVNRQNFEKHFQSLSQTDLILLPEMFTTGFTMNSSGVAEGMEGPSMEWMHQQAEKQKAVVCGTLIIEENKQYFNRLIWMQPNGQYAHYDKRHLFRMANEDQHFSPGKERLVVELKGWKICPLICYDLRFPVFSRNLFKTDQRSYVEPEYDLLLYVANWPAPRVEAWKKLLFARAIENQVYVLGLNRIGKDGKGIDYSGGSLILDAKGESIWEAKDNQECIQTEQLSWKELEEFRKKFPVGMDADKFNLGS
ncbi:MAG: amidohydrolase [Vicingaceae bacterium]